MCGAVFPTQPEQEKSIGEKVLIPDVWGGFSNDGMFAIEIA